MAEPDYPDPKRERGVLARRFRSGFGNEMEAPDYPDPRRERGGLARRFRSGF